MRRYLYVMGLIECPLSRRFGAEGETSAHVLCVSDKQNMGTFFLDPEGVITQSLGAVWNFSK